MLCKRMLVAAAHTAFCDCCEASVQRIRDLTLMHNLPSGNDCWSRLRTLSETCHDVMLCPTERSQTVVSSITQSIVPSKAAADYQAQILLLLVETAGYGSMLS
ncbi:TPA: hypothetical protein ACH3X3_000062 [Trebouxia sp. C0006]